MIVFLYILSTWLFCEKDQLMPGFFDDRMAEAFENSDNSFIGTAEFVRCGCIIVRLPILTSPNKKGCNLHPSRMDKYECPYL